MKNSKYLFTSIILISLIILYSACKNEDEKELNDTTEINLTDTSTIDVKVDTASLNDTVSNNTEKVEVQTKYVCPLGDTEGDKDEPGVCPACEMELIENPDYISKHSK